MELAEILTVILLISASVLCIALIYFVYRIVKSVHSIRLDLESLSFRLNPLIESTLELSNKINLITYEVDSQLQMTRSMLSSIREHADKILNVETRIRSGIENAVTPIIKNVTAVGIGVGSFWKSYKQKSIK
jgi:uncharacterized protein YoxC